MHNYSVVDGRPIQLDIWSAGSAADPRPAIVFFHSGKLVGEFLGIRPIYNTELVYSIYLVALSLHSHSINLLQPGTEELLSHLSSSIWRPLKTGHLSQPTTGFSSLLQLTTWSTTSLRSLLTSLAISLKLILSVSRSLGQARVGTLRASLVFIAFPNRALLSPCKEVCIRFLFFLHSPPIRYLQFITHMFETNSRLGIL